MIRLVIADDEELVRTGLRTILGAEPDLDVVGEAADGLAPLEVVRREAPDVLLLDIRMPVLDGIEVARQLGEEASRTSVVVLTTFDNDDCVCAALRAGASGFELARRPGPRDTRALSDLTERNGRCSR